MEKQCNAKQKIEKKGKKKMLDAEARNVGKTKWKVVEGKKLWKQMYLGMKKK